MQYVDSGVFFIDHLRFGWASLLDSRLAFILTGSGKHRNLFNTSMLTAAESRLIILMKSKSNVGKLFTR